MELPPNIILIGFMGSGKTSTGRELAKILHAHFWDMDQWIEEKNGKKIFCTIFQARKTIKKFSAPFSGREKC